MLHVIAEFTARSGQEDALRQALRDVLAPTRAEDGCHEYTLLADSTQPDHLILREQWRDDAALDAHFGQPHMKQLIARFDELLATPPAIHRLREMG
ncbi:putative quinol monooxygenase [Teichococcus vastitatis]|jgi:quinol monooxygenase YgiN|uniref:Antibiotic biosynthesis monooxygenase n=1 Tax=Teichococcus vastitatis TaxID=2307076 RepID=A0ABS9W715_9PROT|nr:putative quinol monooxygenase [Pseudoroseomonas vastitatis]MCI0754575.1 antibiotic biosynthesis monooxygenase [Pseudoroseomonas vastitatis]